MNISPAIDESIHYFFGIFNIVKQQKCQVEIRHATSPHDRHGATSVGVGSILQQQTHYPNVTILNCPHERSISRSIQQLIGNIIIHTRSLIFEILQYLSRPRFVPLQYRREETSNFRALGLSFRGRRHVYPPTPQYRLRFRISTQVSGSDLLSYRFFELYVYFIASIWHAGDVRIAPAVVRAIVDCADCAYATVELPSLLCR
jgi:hypothetical protein